MSKLIVDLIYATDLIVVRKKWACQQRAILCHSSAL